MEISRYNLPVHIPEPCLIFFIDLHSNTHLWILLHYDHSNADINELSHVSEYIFLVNNKLPIFHNEYKKHDFILFIHVWIVNI
jgi:hypothetical protein